VLRWLLGVPPPPSEPNAGGLYRELIEQQVQEESARKKSFEQRGITVITSAGAFVSLVFGIGVVATAQHLQASGLSRIVLAVAVLAFAAAAACGIVVNLPMRYLDVTNDQMWAWVTERLWNMRAGPAARRAARLRVRVVTRARNRNHLKGRWLISAIVLEVGAIFLVAVAVILIVGAPPPPAQTTRASPSPPTTVIASTRATPSP
jgi:hypothetical protein